jgi:serine O-acetyltransferase
MKTNSNQALPDSQEAEIASTWNTLLEDARLLDTDPALHAFFRENLLQQENLAVATANLLSGHLENSLVQKADMKATLLDALLQEPSVLYSICQDLRAYRERDAACSNLAMPFLYFKGFHALQCYRIAHWYHGQGRLALAFYLQNMISQQYDVDIHPGASIGWGIMIDHATGLVIGETAVVEDNVSILHSVTLGGSGTECGQDRHPKIRQGVLLATGAKILGCVEVGEGAKVAAGSLVLEDVPAHTTVAGVPARVVGRPRADQPALSMDQDIGDTNQN